MVGLITEASILLVFLTVMIHGAPTPNFDRWINKCRGSSDSADYFVKKTVTTSIEIQDMHRFIVIVRNRAAASGTLTGNMIKIFKVIFNSPEFHQSMLHRRLEKPVWVPEVTAANSFSDVKEVLRSIFDNLQYYALNFDVILIDRTTFNSNDLSSYKDISDALLQLICEMDLGFEALNIVPNLKDTSDAVADEHMYIRLESKRNLRDFLILKEFVRDMEHIVRILNDLLKLFNQEMTKDMNESEIIDSMF